MYASSNVTNWQNYFAQAAERADAGRALNAAQAAQKYFNDSLAERLVEIREQVAARVTAEFADAGAGIAAGLLDVDADGAPAQLDSFWRVDQ